MIIILNDVSMIRSIIFKFIKTKSQILVSFECSAQVSFVG